MPRTLWWENNQLKMIDQRILPLTYTVLSYDDYRAVAQAITDMVVRGAPAIGAAGAYGMALAAFQSGATDRDGLLADLRAAKQVLDASRPTAVNLSWATTTVLDDAAHLVLLLTSTTSGRRSWPRRTASRTRTWRSTGAWARSAPRSSRRGPTS